MVEEAPAMPSLVDQIIGFVTGNIPLVGGGLAGVVLLAVLAGFIRKRKAAVEHEEPAAPTEFPDFDSAADEAAAADDDDDGPEIDIDIESDADKTAFIGEVESAELAKGASRPAAAEPAPVEAQAAAEDPLAEVNVFLAYEHFDQAEEFVRDAIKKQPSNLDFHSKLLEVFYSAGEKAKYEAEARVLNDLVGGEGPHWEMATIMWQEMSPNRALFAEAAEGEEEARQDATASRGIVDLTADEAGGDDASLDFDLGAAGEAPAPATAKQAADSDDMLDITSGKEDVLDVTAADAPKDTDEDLLDVTAAVGLDSIPEDSGDANSIDMTSAGDQEDILDISTAGGDDPLDVTAHTDIEADSDEDLLDVTSALGKAAASEALDVAASPAKADDNSLDLDIGGLDLDVPASASGESLDSVKDDGNIIDFDAALASPDGGAELDLSSDEPAGADAGGLELTLDTGDDADNADAGLTLDDDSSGQDNAGEIKFDLTIEDEATAAPEIDMESTVKIPKGSSGLTLEDDDDDDDSDHTVFVPRTADAKEQSAEDEVATKLDLAKAYVELGDKDSAKSILQEILAEGNAAQKKQAQDLMKQVS
jgi:pilus assembly protein FimV